MTDRARLERRYRRLLACYPRSFRAEHEEEMLVVLLACARDGRRRPGVADAANLLANALRVRLGSRAPRSIPAAYWGVRLMALAAALELGAAATVLASRDTLHRAITQHYPQLTSGHVAALVSAHTRPVLIGAPIVAVLWVVLGRANDRGLRWARGGAAALVGLTSLSLLTGISDHAATYAVADLVVGVVLWAVSVIATGLIVSPWADRHYRAIGGGSRRSPAFRPTGSDAAAWN
jgi:hypothetical protein